MKGNDGSMRVRKKCRHLSASQAVTSLMGTGNTGIGDCARETAVTGDLPSATDPPSDVEKALLLAGPGVSPRGRPDGTGLRLPDGDPMWVGDSGFDVESLPVGSGGTRIAGPDELAPGAF